MPNSELCPDCRGIMSERARRSIRARWDQLTTPESRRAAVEPAAAARRGSGKSRAAETAVGGETADA